MIRPSSFQNRFTATPGSSSSGKGCLINGTLPKSEDSSQDWWPKTDTKAEWGAPPRAERQGALKPNVMDSESREILVGRDPRNLVSLESREIDIAEISQSMKKQNEETLEVSFTSKKTYHLGEVPSETGVIRVAVDKIIVPTFGHPFNLYVNGSCEKFEILKENCKDAIEYSDDVDDSREKSGNVILDKKIELIVKELPNGGYERFEELTYTFPTSAKITFYVATTTE